MESSNSGVSFGFSSRKEHKRLKKSAIKDEESDAPRETDYVTSLEGKRVQRY